MSGRDGRWALVRLNVGSALTLLTLVLCHTIYAYCRMADAPFLAHLDVISIIGMPLSMVLLSLEPVLRCMRRPADTGLVAELTTLYRLYDAEDRLLYVGISRTPERRMHQHALAQSWWPEVARTELAAYRDRECAARAEHAAIRGEDPLYNKARHSLEAHVRMAVAQ